MGWRMKLAGVAVVAGGIGVAGLYLKDSNVRIPAAQSGSPYTETVAFKLDSGQAIQVRVARCDLGVASRQLILKVYGEVANLAPTDAPSHVYRFFLSDG